MALLLSRRLGESITVIVPPSTETRVVRIALDRVVSGRRARLAFDAATEVRIMRTELVGLAGSARPPAAEAATEEVA